ncbi:MAG TPA: LuxR C-terminal-related transcriptional regulator [Polyangiaceae bacterium]|nr:LuxR C-terminal-related transcriptional regulator [Polyangiaceae bacterium]
MARRADENPTQDRAADFAASESEIRSIALAADALSQEVGKPVNPWAELAQGSQKLLGSFSTSERHYLVTVHTTRASNAVTPTTSANVELLEDVIMAGSQKAIAMERGLSPSTVTAKARQALGFIGLSAAPSYIPPLIIILVTATRTGRQLTGARQTVFCFQERKWVVFSVPRPDLKMQSLQPPAEWQVMQMLVEGRPYAEMAIQRRSSKRTIANQVAASFRRLQVSGRTDLVRVLTDLSARGPEVQPPAFERT